MKRIAIIADSHFDETSRFDECIRIHDWIADDIEHRGIDLVLHSGDVFERKSTPRERLAFASWLQDVAASAPVVIVRGNHDAVGDLRLFEAVETNHPVDVVEDARVVRVGGVGIACVAWPRKAQLLSTLEGAGREIGEITAADALRSVLRGLGAQMADFDGPRVLLMHAMVRGSRVSTSQPLVGCDLEIGLEDLALVSADAYALGHIHMGQSWEVGGAPVIYPGSPRRTAFGEVEEKCYVVLTFDGRELVDVERVPTPATPMLLGEDEWGNGEWLCGWNGLDPVTAEGAEIRLRYRVAADEREAARAAVEQVALVMRVRGAISVKVEEVVIAEQRTRAPEIARAVTLAEKLSALWTARGFDPGARRDALVSKASEIAGEAA